MVLQALSSCVRPLALSGAQVKRECLQVVPVPKEHFVVGIIARRYLDLADHTLDLGTGDTPGGGWAAD